ncbi:MAG: hypothetical protein J0H19_04660 [Rhodospirillales bacterium]|nr:hypothetical protein [Rhodospirillales bacterium]MBN8925897.1 hypothetical protein [Rhodospirillales bacterium]
MQDRLKTIIGASALAAGLLAAPVILYAQEDTARMMGGGSDNMMGGGPMIGQGSRGMMSGGMMGCSEMMQSRNGSGNGTPNSQWRKHPAQNPDNRG